MPVNPSVLLMDAFGNLPWREIEQLRQGREGLDINRYQAESQRQNYLSNLALAQKEEERKAEEAMRKREGIEMFRRGVGGFEAADRQAALARGAAYSPEQSIYGDVGIRYGQSEPAPAPVIPPTGPPPPPLTEDERLDRVMNLYMLSFPDTASSLLGSMFTRREIAKNNLLTQMLIGSRYDRGLQTRRDVAEAQQAGAMQRTEVREEGATKRTEKQQEGATGRSISSDEAAGRRELRRSLDRNWKNQVDEIDVDIKRIQDAIKQWGPVTSNSTQAKKDAVAGLQNDLSERQGYKDFLNKKRRRLIEMDEAEVYGGGEGGGPRRAPTTPEEAGMKIEVEK